MKLSKRESEAQSTAAPGALEVVCPQAGLLAHMRSGALRAGLIVEAQSSPGEGLLEVWIEQIRRRWPSSILFKGDDG
jgi:hypothetical protein